MGWATREQGHARPTHLTGGRGLGPRGARWRAASIVGGLGGCGDVWTCVCERGSVLEGPRKEVLGKGTKEGTCSLSDAGGNVQGKDMLGKGGQRKEHARLVTRVEMCAGKKCSQMSDFLP